MSVPVGLVCVDPVRPATSTGTEMDVVVLFTDVPSTLRALRTAGQLARGLTARIRLLVLRCVPYPLPVEDPPVDVNFLGICSRQLVDQCEVDTTAEVCLCRDQWDALQSRLAPHSVVVIGKRSRWWPRLEDRLAKKLRAAGHHVVRTSLQKETSYA